MAPGDSAFTTATIPLKERIPPRIMEALLDYRHAHRHPGDTLKALLRNDMVTYWRRADSEGRAAMPWIIEWCYWELPPPAWRSEGAVSAWLAPAITPKGES